ncbi:MAG: xanthine dehydrogenase family protein molybdopterin-binding subunit [Candidatus Bipolaricaulota bacterium]|nr:xanthine dehydrogenase family protein molybdopterin-binding subunit [Candidatus Bipolaricaulota bacterium]
MNDGRRGNTKNKGLPPGEMIGAPVLRPDAIDKVRGEAKYVGDLVFSGMLHARVIRSTMPHARLRGVDLSSVEKDPSVVCTVTADEVPGENIVHVVYDDQPALAKEIVRYIGEPIALVAASDRLGAERAAKLAVIDYEPLPIVSDPIVALSDDAPAVAVPEVVEEGKNVFNHMRLRKGDTEDGFAQADVIVEGEYRTGYQEHAYLETQGAIAVPDENGSMTIYGSMQCPFYVQGAVARVLGLPLAKVRVVQTTTGGAFGGKEDVPSLVSSLAALLAWKARKPVKLIYDRSEDILTSSKRHPAIVHYKSGAKRDGTITAIEADFVYNAGAYQTLSSAVLWRGLMHIAGPYRIPNVKVDGYSVATNTVPCGAFRGFGSPQVIFAHESQMDKLADKLGIDRLEMRRRNVLRVGDKTSTNQLLEESVGVLETIDKAGEMAHWQERLSGIDAFNVASEDRKRGIGISTITYGVGLGGKAPFLDKAGAYMKLEADGSVAFSVGTVEMGQGLITALTQIASEALQVPVERIHMAQVDSSRVPDSGPTVASRGTMISGLAVVDAARKLRERIVGVATDLGISEEDISGEMPKIAETFWLSNLDPAVEGWSKTAPVDWDAETGLGNAYMVYAYATHIAEVEIDMATGEVSVEEFVAVHDSGKIVNRQLASGQVEGGIAQGLGYALMEEIPQKDGKLLTSGFTTYRIPTIRDVAPNTKVGFVEAVFSYGPYGAKGLGEVPLMASHTAVSRAVAHALKRDVNSYPLSPDRVKEIAKR